MYLNFKLQHLRPNLEANTYKFSARAVLEDMDSPRRQYPLCSGVCTPECSVAVVVIVL